MNKIFIITRKKFEHDGIGTKEKCTEELEFNISDQSYQSRTEPKYNSGEKKLDTDISDLYNNQQTLVAFRYNNIYVFHSLIGINYNEDYFIALRDIVVKHYCEIKDVKTEDIEVNWLVHGSTDFHFGSNSVDAFLFSERADVARKSLIDCSNLFNNIISNDTFKKDNFWNFTHQKTGRNRTIYEQYILKVEYKNADELFNCLFYDEKEMIYQANLLKNLGLLDKVEDKDFDKDDPVYKPFLDYLKRRELTGEQKITINSRRELIDALNKFNTK